MFEKPLFLGRRQASEEQSDADEVNERLLRAGESFVIFAQLPMSPQPGKRPLDHPASGNDVEPRVVAQIRKHIRSIALELSMSRVDDLDGPPMLLGRPAHQRARVASGPEQARERDRACRLQHPLAAFAVGKAGRMDHHAE